MNSVKSSTCKGPVVVGYGKCALREAHGWMVGLWESLYNVMPRREQGDII